MKKIENIIGSCKDCKFCQRFNPTKGGFGSAFICERTQRLITVASSPYNFEFPNWCPLETYSEKAQAADTANTEYRSTIILPTLPKLEWAPENLSGHGGTQIGANWYYTWDQAMDAAKELGDGWRLPTQEELQQLCDAGSTWVDNGPDGEPGRWFGGNHDSDHEGSVFFPATGYVGAYSGALSSVGAWGGSWCSSPNAEGSAYASHLHFYASSVYPLSDAGRANGLPVRCVREISER